MSQIEDFSLFIVVHIMNGSSANVQNSLSKGLSEVLVATGLFPIINKNISE